MVKIVKALKSLDHDATNEEARAAYADVVKELKGELLRLKKDFGDTDEKYPNLMEVRAKHWD